MQNLVLTSPKTRPARSDHYHEKFLFGKGFDRRLCWENPNEEPLYHQLILS